MLYQCPACQRTFGEAGFCPFDRTALIVPQLGADKQTMLSAGMSAQLGPQPTDPPTIEARRETFPLAPTGDTVTKQRAKAPSEEPRIRSVSASTSEADALEAFRQSRSDNEYDRLVGQTLDGRYFV